MASTLEAALEGTSVTYEQLLEVQEGFDDVEVEIIRQQVRLTKPLLEKRTKVVADIPNFWPLVFEQAPQDIDEYVQPSDSALLLSSLKSLSVSHFEVEGNGSSESGGDPRSISIRFEFGDNDHFEDRVVEKKFWYRHARDGWSGLVSEPVDIKWKTGKDLTKGLLAMVKQLWDEEQQQAAAAPASKKKSSELTPGQKALKKKIEGAGGVGGVSFFAWFGYRGRNVTAEESKEALEKDQERRRLRLEGKQPSSPPAKNGDGEDENGGDEWDEEALEVFPDGDELAICIADDLWPDAIKYFMQAQEQDANSDYDFESDEDDDMEDSTADTPGQPPAKKQKT